MLFMSASQRKCPLPPVSGVSGHEAPAPITRANGCGKGKTSWEDQKPTVRNSDNLPVLVTQVSMRSWELFRVSTVIFSSSEAVSTDSSVRESSESGEDAEGASSGRGASGEPGSPQVLGNV